MISHSIRLEAVEVLKPNKDQAVYKRKSHQRPKDRSLKSCLLKVNLSKRPSRH